nr:MAG TPA: hypothetical protein [Caudoviricetes sp.]
MTNSPPGENDPTFSSVAGRLLRRTGGTFTGNRVTFRRSIHG